MPKTTAERVLIVDDSPLIRRRLESDLKTQGIAHVITADACTAAHAIMREARPDLVLLDLQLADCHGLDLLRTWRADETYAFVPVLIVTASEDAPALEACFEAGADDVVRKPWNPVELAARVRTHLGRRQAETRLRDMERVLSASQRLAAIGGWELDLQTQELTWTEEAYRILDLPTDYVPRVETTLDFYAPEARDDVRTVVENAIDTGAAFEYEAPMITARGRRIYVHAMGKSVKRDGVPVLLWGTLQDITARKNLEDERNRLFDLSLDMLCVGKMSGHFRQVNPAWTRTLGWSEEELLAKPWLDFVHPDDRDATVEALSVLQENRPIIDFENRYLCKNGEVRWLSWNTYPDLERQLVFAVARDVTEHRAYQDRLAYDATHDRLTNLYNRAYLLDELAHQVSSARRYDVPLTFCLCDLDHFKQVNDVHGHQIGDVVLARFAEILCAATRDADLVGRYGGEEFAAVFPFTDLAGAVDCMERARRALETEDFRDRNDTSFAVTATFGLAQYTPDIANADALIAEADAALYRGKEAGRNRVERG